MNKLKLTIVLLFFCLVSFGQLKNGIVLYQKMESLRNERDGTNINNEGATGGQTGKVGEAYDFDGTNDRMYYADASIYDLTEITISCWIFAHTYGSVTGADNFGRIVRKGGNYDLLLGNDVGGGLVNSIKWGSLNGTSNAISLNTWYHIVVTDNGTTAKIYIDGAEDASGSSVIGATNADDLVIANFNNGTATARFFNGLLDEIIISKLAWNQNFVSQHYAGGNGRLYVWQNFINGKINYSEWLNYSLKLNLQS